MASLTLDKPFAEFIKKYLEDNKIDRMKEGKDDSVISVIREALFIWAQQKGISDELDAFLKQT